MKKTDRQVKEKISENFKSLIFAVVAAMLIRTFLYEPFKIPSSSMVPSLQVGDYLFVSKFSYGYSDTGTFFRLPILKSPVKIFALNKPQRGDVAVFKLPSNPKINYIKRVIGEPGDTVQIKDEIVYVNGLALNKEFVGKYIDEKDGREYKKYIEESFSGKKYNVIEDVANERYDNTEEFKVPEGHYFVMGDNRDHSADSRTKQIPHPFVPLENFVGKADIIFFSMKSSPFKIRFNHFFNLINKSI